MWFLLLVFREVLTFEKVADATETEEEGQIAPVANVSKIKMTFELRKGWLRNLKAVIKIRRPASPAQARRKEMLSRALCKRCMDQVEVRVSNFLFLAAPSFLVVSTVSAAEKKR